MGEAILLNNINTGNNDNPYTALIRVQALDSIEITCTNGIETYSNIGSCEFSVGYGTWVLSNDNTSKILEVTELKIYDINLLGSTYGISIDMSNSDPESAVTYCDDAVGMIPLSVNLTSGTCDYGDWADIITDVIGCKPCLYLNGVKDVYLNPDNYAYDVDGNAVDIESGDSGDVMVEFAKLWYKYSVDGDILKFQIANYDRSDDGFVCTAFTSMDGTETIRDYMYYSAYKGYLLSDQIRSLSNKSYTRSIGFTNFRTYCQNNGNNYGMEDWAKRYYVLGLLMLVTKTRGIQEKVGYGSKFTSTTYGSFNTSGLFTGFANDGTKEVKCFGIEGLWGCCNSYCDGLMSLSTSTLGYKKCAPYNHTGDGYTNIASGWSHEGSYLYPTAYTIIMDGAAIVPSVGQSDSTLGWCDVILISDNELRVASVGDYYDSYHPDRFGPFHLFIGVSYNYTGGNNYNARIVAS